MYVTIDPTTRQILSFGSVQPPNGNWQVVDDAQINNLRTAGDKVLANDNSVSVTPPPTPPPPPDYTKLRTAIVTQAQSAVGVDINSLTNSQRLALVVCLLYESGAIDPTTLTVKPLAQWIGG